MSRTRYNKYRITESRTKQFNYILKSDKLWHVDCNGMYSEAKKVERRLHVLQTTRGQALIFTRATAPIWPSLRTTHTAPTDANKQRHYSTLQTQHDQWEKTSSDTECCLLMQCDSFSNFSLSKKTKTKVYCLHGGERMFLSTDLVHKVDAIKINLKRLNPLRNIQITAHWGQILICNGSSSWKNKIEPVTRFDGILFLFFFFGIKQLFTSTFLKCVIHL